MPTTDAIWTRRRLLVAGCAAAVVAFAPMPAAATAVTRAEALVTSLSAELLALINSGRSEAQLYAAFEQILVRYGDMPAVAASVLGPPWRNASAAQRQAFVAAFQSYISRRYGRQFREYQNARINVVRVRDAGNSGVLVQTVVVRPSQQDIHVEWQVSERSGNAKVVNLIIEGVSMLANERAEIGAMLEAQRGSIDGLINAMRARA
jgi:phospholipid transport system substrate-binding protein